ncbi:MAG: hypothetical protein ACKOXO_00440 [Cyanobium sp.]
MTNLQQNAQILSPRTLQRLWFSVPVGAIGVATLMFAFAVLMPLWQTLQKDSQRLGELEVLRSEVSLMRQQLRAQDQQEEKALQQKDKLFRLIAGSGNISTILAVLDREAKLAGVQLDLVEPQAAAPPTPAPAQAPPPPPAGQQKAEAPNALQLAGLQPQAMLISARGHYPELLAFLRRLESLSVLVIPSNLRLEGATAAAAPAPGSGPAAEVTMKINLTLYGQPPQTGQAAPQAGATTGAPAGQAPAVGQGSPAGQPPGGQPQGAAGSPAATP